MRASHVDYQIRAYELLPEASREDRSIRYQLSLRQLFELVCVSRLENEVVPRFVRPLDI